MKRGTLIRAMFVLAVLAFAGSLALRSDWTGDKLCAELQRRVPQLAPGVKLQIAQCRVAPLELGVNFKGLRISLPHQPDPTIQAERVEVRLSVLQALWGSLRLERLTLDHPRLDLDLSHLPAAPAGAKQVGRCNLAAALDQVDIAQLALTDGAVSVALPGERAVSLSQLDISARSWRGVSTVRLSQAGGKLSFPGGELPLEKLSVAASLDAPAADLDVKRLQLQGGQLSLLAHGSVHDLCAPDLNVAVNAGIPLDLVVALLRPAKVKAEGYLTLNANVTGQLDAPGAHAELDFSDLDIDDDGDDFNPKELSASVDVHDDKIEVSQLYWPLSEGFARASATITRKGNWPISVSAEGKNVPFGELMNRLPVKHPWVEFGAGVKGRLSGHLLPTLSLSGPASVDLSDFHVRTRAWDAPAKRDDEVLHIAKARVETELSINPERVRLGRAKLSTQGGGAALVDAILYTDPSRGLDITGDISHIDLGELGPIAGLPWGGAGSVMGIHIGGPYGKQVIDGAVDLEGFSVASVHPGHITGAVHFDPDLVLAGKDLAATVGKTTLRGHGLLDFSAPKMPAAEGELAWEDGRVEDLLEMLRDVNWAFDAFHGRTTGKVSGSVTLAKGPVRAPTSDIQLQLRDLVAFGRPLGDGDFAMHSEAGETLTVPEFSLVGAAGTWMLGGSQQVGGELDYHLRARGVPAALATSPELADWSLRGTLAGSATVTGTQAEPEVHGEMSAQGLGGFGLPLGTAKLEVVGVGNAMQVSGQLGDDVTVQSQVRWEGNFPLHAKLTFDVPNLASYVPARPGWSDVGGKVQGTLALQGDLRGTAGYRGEYLLPKVSFSKGDYVEENTEPVRLAFDGDRYTLESFSFRGHALGGSAAQATVLSVQGTRQGPEHALDVRVNGSIDAKLFETVVPAIDDSSGHARITAHLTGTQDKPLVVGTLSLSRGRLKLRDFPLAFEDLDAELGFTQAAVEIDKFGGVLNGGRLDLSGTVGLSHFRPGSYDVRLMLDGTKWRFANLPPATLSGALQLSGRASDPVLSGSIGVDSFIYDQDLYLNSLVSNLTRQKLDAQTFTKRTKVVRFADLEVHLDGDVEVRNNLVKTKLKGDLSVLGDDAHPLLRGDIEAAPGGTATFRNNEFTLDQLLVSFRDSERITPEFDIHATTIARDYKISLHAFGTADNTHTELSSTPDLAQGDILTLLTLGFTSQDRTGIGNSAALGVGVDVLSSITGIDRAAGYFIPKNTILRDPSLRVTSTYSQALGSMQPTAEIEGKLFTDQLRLRVQEPVVAGGKGLRMQGEYRFNDSSSVQMQLDRDNSDYNFPDVGLDLKLRWEMK